MAEDNGLRFAPVQSRGPRRTLALGEQAAWIPDLGAGVRLDVLPFPGVVLLSREEASRVAASRAVETVLGVELPTDVGRVVSGTRCEILCLPSPAAEQGAMQWFAVVSAGQEEVITPSLNKAFALEGAAGVALDLSDGYRVFHLYGPSVARLLERGMTEGSVQEVGVGECARWLLADVPCVVQGLGGEDVGLPIVYRLFAPASMARFLIQFLRDQSQDF